MNNQEKLKKFLAKKKRESAKKNEKTYISTLDESVKLPCKRMLTGLLTVDYLLHGLAEGSLYEICGDPSSGKSTLCWKIMEKLQYIYPGIAIYYNDIEGTSKEESFISRFPLLKRDEIVIDANINIEDFFTNLEEMANMVDLIFIDTISSMDPKSKIDLEKSEMGKLAGIFTRGWKRFFDVARDGIRIIAINQTRDRLNPYESNQGPKTPGGSAYRYALTGQIEVKRDGGQSKAEKEKDIFGNEKVKSWNTIIKIYKNKQGPFGKSISTSLNTSDEGKDKFETFDEVKDLIAFAKVLGFIETSGATNIIYNQKDGTDKIKLKGKEALEEHLRNNIDDYIELKMFIYNKILPPNFFYSLYDKLLMIMRAEKVMFDLRSKLNFDAPIQTQLKSIKPLDDEEVLEELKKEYPIQLFFDPETIEKLKKEYGEPWNYKLKEDEEVEDEED